MCEQLMTKNIIMRSPVFVSLLPHAYLYSPWDSGGSTQRGLTDCRLRMANDFLVVTKSLICSFMFLIFHWLTFYHMTPFRMKPSQVATPVSEYVSSRTKGLC